MLTIQVGHSYFLRFDRKQWERGKPYPPLATLHVAALLRRMGHEVSLFDSMLAEGVDEFDTSLRGGIFMKDIEDAEPAGDIAAELGFGRIVRDRQRAGEHAREGN